MVARIGIYERRIGASRMYLFTFTFKQVPYIKERTTSPPTLSPLHNPQKNRCKSSTSHPPYHPPSPPPQPTQFLPRGLIRRAASTDIKARYPRRNIARSVIAAIPARIRFARSISCRAHTLRISVCFPNLPISD